MNTIAHHTQSKTLSGLLCGMGAGALWGLVFLAPEVARNFSPLELTIGRYLAYGLISAIWIAPRWKKLLPLFTRQNIFALTGLALAGNTVYYILLSNAVQLGGIAMTSLVIGFVPVVVTIIGSKEHGAVPLSRLLLSIVLSAAGAVCIGWQALALPLSTSFTVQLSGFLCAIGALASWTWFTVANRNALNRISTVSALDWNLLIGLMTGMQALVLIPLAWSLVETSHTGLEWIQLASVSMGIALFASIAGNALWNRMSRLLPLTLIGQMILFETMFALLYGFLWEQRLPTLLEMLAFIFVIASVVTCLRAHRKPMQPARILPEAA